MLYLKKGGELKPWREWREPGWWQVSEEEWAWRSGEWKTSSGGWAWACPMPHLPNPRMMQADSCVGLSGARGLTLKEGHPLLEVAWYKLHFFAHSVKSRGRMKSVLILSAPKARFCLILQTKPWNCTSLTGEAPNSESSKVLTHESGFPLLYCKVSFQIVRWRDQALCVSEEEGDSCLSPPSPPRVPPWTHNGPYFDLGSDLWSCNARLWAFSHLEL